MWRLLESITDGFCAFDAEWRFTFLNRAALTILAPHLGGDARQLLGRDHWEVFPETRGTIIEQEYRRAVAEQVAVEFEVFYPPWESWFAVRGYPIGGGGMSAYFRDITAEKRALETLRARQRAEDEVARLSAESAVRLAELETLLEVLPVGIGIASDRECRAIRVNPAFARVLGIAVEANASKTAPEPERPGAFRVLDDAGREVAGDDLPMQVAAREGRELRDLEYNIVHADGRSVRLLEYAAPLFDASGQPRGAVGAFVDITERRMAEERHRFLVALDDAVHPLSAPGEIVATAARLLGEHLGADRCAYADVEADEDTMNLTGDYCRGVPSIVGRYTFTQFGSEVLRLMRADEPFAVEDIETHRPAPEDLVAYRATLIRAVICVPLHKAGKFVAAMAVHQRVPRRWRADEVALVLHVANRCWEALERARVTRDLGASEERFRTLADNIAQLAWMADPEGWIFWYNRRWFHYTGTTLEQMQGWGWEAVHHPKHLACVVEKWQQHLRAGKEWEDTFPLRGADGEYRWFLSRAFPIRDAEGKVQRWFGTNTDVTEQRAAAEALARAKEQAEAASKAKDDFLAALSHELRTPLTPVLMAAEDLCDDPTLPPPMHETLCMMRRNIALEARLIDDLLDLTRIASGKLSLREQECDAHSLIGLALDIVRDEAQTKGLALVEELAATQTHLVCDPARLQQVFWNLLKNAVKFTPAGGRIAIRSRDADGRIVIEVSDTGIGIAPASLESLFLPFEQAGLVNDHRFGGLGLGLSNSRTLVEMHGGKIAACSKGAGRGATFVVELPVPEKSTRAAVPPGNGEANAVSSTTPSATAPLRLLLVEDHEATLAVLERLLTRAGHTVFTAASVQAAREVAARTRVDGVISDIGLPDGSGIDLMTELSTTYGLSGIALSGYGMDDDVQRSRAAGFVTHLVKPVDFSQLRKALTLLTPTDARTSRG